MDASEFARTLADDPDLEKQWQLLCLARSVVHTVESQLATDFAEAEAVMDVKRCRAIVGMLNGQNAVEP
jgi:negative regulator of sigma E activity